MRTFISAKLLGFFLLGMVPGIAFGEKSESVMFYRQIAVDSEKLVDQILANRMLRERSCNHLSADPGKAEALAKCQEAAQTLKQKRDELIVEESVEDRGDEWRNKKGILAELHFRGVDGMNASDNADLHAASIKAAAVANPEAAHANIIRIHQVSLDLGKKEIEGILPATKDTLDACIKVADEIKSSNDAADQLDPSRPQQAADAEEIGKNCEEIKTRVEKYEVQVNARIAAANTAIAEATVSRDNLVSANAAPAADGVETQSGSTQGGVEPASSDSSAGVTPENPGGDQSDPPAPAATRHGMSPMLKYGAAAAVIGGGAYFLMKGKKDKEAVSKTAKKAKPGAFGMTTSDLTPSTSTVTSTDTATTTATSTSTGTGTDTSTDSSVADQTVE